MLCRVPKVGHLAKSLFSESQTLGKGWHLATVDGGTPLAFVECHILTLGKEALC